MKYTLIYLFIILGTSCTKEFSDEIIDQPLEEPGVVKTDRILVDASHDGGVWWFPQGGTFDPSQPHQGKKLADLLRAKGFIVDELARNTIITAELFSKYSKVIRAGCYGMYSQAELDAYRSLLSRPSSLLVAGEFLRPGSKDQLAEMLGLQMAGVARGYVEVYANHEITSGATPFYYNAGSVVMNLENKNIVPLGWLEPNAFADFNGNEKADPGEPTGSAVMGIIKHPMAKIFFIGDINGLEHTPQPLTDEIVTWLFQ